MATFWRWGLLGIKRDPQRGEVEGITRDARPDPQRPGHRTAEDAHTRGQFAETENAERFFSVIGAEELVEGVTGEKFGQAEPRR